MLSDAKIRNAKPAPAAYKLYDGGGLGLFLEVTPSGSRRWRVKYSRQGRETLKSLGLWPLVPLKEARAKAAAFRKELAEGNGLSREAKEPAFREVAEDWAARFLPLLAPRTGGRYRFYLDMLVLPVLKDLKVKDVTPRIILDQILRPVEVTGHVETLYRVKTLLSKIFRFAVAAGLMERDFTLDLRGALTPLTHGHMAAVTDPGALGALLRNIDSYGGGLVVAYALKILPYVFVRPGELRNAVWEEFDLDGAMWRIPAPRMKMKDAHAVPLAAQVRSMLAELRGITGGGRFLFPGAQSRTRPISDMAVNSALRRMGYGKHEITGHGFRSTASTLLNEGGFPPDWIELQLAHKERNGVRAAYNRALYLQERAKMMQEWADYLDSLRDGTPPPARWRNVL
ncbi:MAG: tyrosine-type recombinase/integrase [Deltaproteobacteria bacterium]|jgi:integrase|nr:tyrosine-type recombinase/integrase [Deltaproteobacteria bacterium]